MLTWILAIFVLILIGFVILGLYIWIRRHRYTRERFAFVALSTISTMFLTALTSIMSQETPWQALMIVISKKLNIEYNPGSPDFIHYAFILLLFGIAIYAIIKIHANWINFKGAISLQQFNREKRYEPSGISKEGIGEIMRILNKQPPLEVYEPLDSNKLPGALEEPTDSLAWNIQARDLFILRSPSYYFNMDEWHDRECCWVGENRKSGGMVFLFCTINEPKQEEISRFSEYSKELAHKSGKSKSDIELIAAVKNGNNTRNIEIDGMVCKVETEESLLDGLIDFSDYYWDIKNRVEKEHLSDSTLTLKDVYTPSYVRIDENGTNKENVESYLRSWLDESGKRQLAILGEYGQGKSTCALLFTFNLISDYDENPPRVPILLELRGKSPRNMTPEELLAAWAVRYNH